MLIAHWYYSEHETFGRTLSFFPGPRRPSPSGDRGCAGRHVAGPGLSCFWRLQAVGQQLEPAQQRRRGGRASLPCPWSAAGIVFETLSSGHGRAVDQRALPGSTEDAVCSVDPGSRSDLILQRFGIRLSVWTVGRYLRRWGFTPQKPLRRAYEQDPKAVRRWLKRRYPAIRALSLREKATIFWGDETGMRSDHQAGPYG